MPLKRVYVLGSSRYKNQPDIHNSLVVGQEFLIIEPKISISGRIIKPYFSRYSFESNLQRRGLTYDLTKQYTGNFLLKFSPRLYAACNFWEGMIWAEEKDKKGKEWWYNEDEGGWTFLE